MIKYLKMQTDLPIYLSDSVNYHALFCRPYYQEKAFMRIITLSVDGFIQSAKRGLLPWLEQQDADIICLQDIRCSENTLLSKKFSIPGYYSYCFESESEQEGGVAIYSRRLPKALIRGFNIFSGWDARGSYLHVDFETLSVGSLMIPSGLEDANDGQHIKKQFCDDLLAYFTKIANKKRDFIFCGNWNIAPEKKDVSNWECQNNRSGALANEQLWMKKLSKCGYLDAFRMTNTDGDEFTWWPSGEIGKGEAWRIDHQIVSRSVGRKVEHARISKRQSLSSHLPVIVDYDIDII